MRSLDGKVVVVTGAASGLGRALAVELAGRGARLAISDIDHDGLARTAELAVANRAREVRTDRLDVADRAAYARYAADVATHFGRVNVLVNNAGVALSGDLVELTYSDLEWIVGVNFWGVVHGTKEFLPHLIASGDGHVVTISSLFGLVSMPGQSAYNATKYAIRGLSEALREEMLVAGHPVGVTVVHPGGVKTAIARNARGSGDLDQQARLFDERFARMEPERAARIIVKGVLAGKPRVLVGLDAHAVHQLARLLGARYQDMAAAAGRRTRLPRA
jgi:NADP-dependent 3-hydroxy acid dehydrogenase YdfG